jgi:outer membrane protein assembly factor BamD (BamD/ComL family)
MAYAPAQSIVHITPESRYNEKSERMVAALRAVSAQYDRLALAANAYAGERNRISRFMDANDPYSGTDQLYGQLERQAEEFEQLTTDLKDAAKDFNQSLDWVKPRNELN